MTTDINQIVQEFQNDEQSRETLHLTDDQESCIANKTVYPQKENVQTDDSQKNINSTEKNTDIFFNEKFSDDNIRQQVDRHETNDMNIILNRFYHPSWKSEKFRHIPSECKELLYSKYIPYDEENGDFKNAKEMKFQSVEFLRNFITNIPKQSSSVIPKHNFEQIHQALIEKLKSMSQQFQHDKFLVKFLKLCSNHIKKSYCFPLHEFSPYVKLDKTPNNIIEKSFISLILWYRNRCQLDFMDKCISDILINFIDDWFMNHQSYPIGSKSIDQLQTLYDQIQKIDDSRNDSQNDSQNDSKNDSKNGSQNSKKSTIQKSELDVKFLKLNSNDTIPECKRTILKKSSDMNISILEIKTDKKIINFVNINEFWCELNDN